MSKIWFTDEDADIAGYKRARVETRGDNPSLVRATTATVLGPATIALLRRTGVVLQWITDPLSGPSLTAGTWTLHLWAYENSLAINAGLHLEVDRFTTEETSVVVTGNTLELPIVTKDLAFVTGAATPTVLNVGDRLVFKVSALDVGGILQIGSVVVSYNGLYPRAEGDSYIIAPDEIEEYREFRDDDITAIREMIRDTGGLNTRLETSVVERCLRQALNTYSVARPRVIATLISGDGNSFDFPLPTKWIWGFSRVVGLEYPAGEQIPRVLDTIDWEIREDILGVQPVRFFRLKTIVPETGTQNLWIQYTTKHEYTTEINTIPSEDFDAVLWLATSYCALELASQGAGSVDSNLGADVVNYRDMEARWRSVARSFKELFDQRVIHPDSATPVGTTEEWKPVMETGFNFLWHGRRVRRVR